MAGLDAFHQLALERERTLFMFYGYRWARGDRGGGYFKHAHSLSEALADLDANEGVADEGGYFVKDAFIESTEDGPVVHVELISAQRIVQIREEKGES